jgi:hypothetical protein
MSPYHTLWLVQQIPAFALVLMLVTSGLGSGRFGRDNSALGIVCCLGALGLGGGFFWEVGTVLTGGLPAAVGTWQTPWRWVLLAALFFLGREPSQQFRIASVVGALALAAVEAFLPAIVLVAYGMLENNRPRRFYLAASIVSFAGAGALLHHKMWLWGIVASLGGLSFDETTVATTLIIGFVELLGWGAAIAFPASIDGFRTEQKVQSAM